MNTLNTLLATPIPFTIKLDDRREIDLNFSLVTLSYRELFKRKWGEKNIYKALENFDLEIFTGMLFYLLPKSEKEKLDDLSSLFEDYDENDELVNLAPRRIDKLRFLLNKDVEATIKLVLLVWGTSLEEVTQRQVEFDSMSEAKKKETLADIQKLTGQDYSHILLKKPDGPLKQSAT